MKGLQLAVGLVSALFFNSVYSETIYDLVAWDEPKIEIVILGSCQSVVPSPTVSADQCNDISEEVYDSGFSHDNCSTSDSNTRTEFIVKESSSGHMSYFSEIRKCKDSSLVRSIHIGTWYKGDPVESKICPPSLNPSFTYTYDYDLDGDYDRCYNPFLLDQASSSTCADMAMAGLILAGNSLMPKDVCYTNPLDKSQCAFQLQGVGSQAVYVPNLEGACFGDPFPPYEEPPLDPPTGDECKPFGDNGFMCAADPNDKCDANGVCEPGCGYVNDQFVCFGDEDCTGPNCEQPPVNCDTNPSAPGCEKPPTPENCQTNPSLPGCEGVPTPDQCKENPNLPGCDSGGDGEGPGEGGEGQFILDYGRLIKGVDDAVKQLVDAEVMPDGSEFDTFVKETETEHLGLFEDITSDSVFSDLNEAAQKQIFSSIDNMFPSSGSGSCSFSVNGNSVDMCFAASKVRDVLYYVFAFLTMVYLRNTFSLLMRK